MHKGKIKRIVLEKGFGFIADDDGTEVFFHKTSVQGTDFNSLVGNQQVEFEVKKTPKGLSADNVTVVNG